MQRANLKGGKTIGMGALTSLNLADNALGSEGAKHVAEAIKANVSALRFVWYHFELDLNSGSTHELQV